MKQILVFSDTHGKTESLKELIQIYHKNIDFVFHLGDYQKDISESKKKYKNIEFYSVSGNCDFDNIAPNIFEINILGKKILLMHGDKFNVKFSYDKIIYYALNKKSDICLFGHTHNPIIFKEENIVFMNPGSLTFPRGTLFKTYGMIKIDETIALNVFNYNKNGVSDILFSI